MMTKAMKNGNGRDRQSRRRRPDDDDDDDDDGENDVGGDVGGHIGDVRANFDQKRGDRVNADSVLDCASDHDDAGSSSSAASDPDYYRRDYFGDDVVDVVAPPPRPPSSEEEDGLVIINRHPTPSFVQEGTSTAPPPRDVTNIMPSSPDAAVAIIAPSSAVAAASIGHATTTLRNLLRRNRKLRAGRDRMAHTLGVAARRFGAYEGEVSRKMACLEEENRRLLSLLRSSCSSSSSSWSPSPPFPPEAASLTITSAEDVVATLLRARRSDSDDDDRDDDGNLPTSGKVGGESDDALADPRGNRRRREVRRLKRELEDALGDILMLTDSLETNNVALGAAVLELDKRQRRRRGGRQRGSAVDASRMASEVEGLRRELREREDETERYDDLRRKFNDLALEADSSKNDAVVATERIAKLESELESREGEIDRLRQAAESAASGRNDESKSAEMKTAANDPRSSTRGGNLSFLLTAKEQTDYPSILRQRDLKIKSLEAVVHSSSRIIEKLKLDIERMDSEREEAASAFAQETEKLLEEIKTYEMQVAGFELAFRNLNDQRTSMITSSSRPSHGDDEVFDDDVYLWDEYDNGEDKVEEADLKSIILVLQRKIEELQSSGSFQEDQIETLKAELVRLRVKSQLDKESALAQLSEENKIIAAQRLALEDQLVEINKSAGALRHSLVSTPQSPGNADKVAPGSDPVLIAQVVMLENANKVLESSVNSLRSDTHEKIAPLLHRIEMLSEEKRIVEDEMNTKLHRQETTISKLENSLNQYRALQKAKKNRLKKKGDKINEKSAMIT
jgi:hypothetical protein